MKSDHFLDNGCGEVAILSVVVEISYSNRLQESFLLNITKFLLLKMQHKAMTCLMGLQLGVFTKKPNKMWLLMICLR